MKKIITLILTFALILGIFTSCNTGNSDDTVINIGVMSGPTGMGMAKLMNDESVETKYNFTVYSDPSIGTTDLISGTLDMLCLPTNAAAKLSLTNQDVSVLAVNCLGSLYLLTDNNNTVTSVKDLEGKTIYTSVPTSTTKPIVEYILKQNKVNATIEVVQDHDTLVAMLATGEAPIAVLPEPKVTAALLTNKAYSVDLNLSTEWSNISDSPLTMGCIVVRNEFAKEHKVLVKNFLEDYEASIEYINNKENIESASQMIVDAQVLPKLPVAKGALSNLYGSIVYQDGKKMKKSLVAFYNAIGHDLPDDTFYYEK